MVRLYDNDTGTELGSINRRQLQLLIDRLEEESDEDQDYYINQATLTLLEEAGADAELVGLLRQALDEREGMEVRWEDL